MSRPLLATTLTAVVTAGAAAADVPSAAVDIAPIHSLVARVMDGVGRAALIVPPGASPHGHALRPSEAQALQDADVVFWIGSAMTPWLGGSIETLAPDARSVELLAVPGTTELEMRDTALFDTHDHDNDHAEAEGDDDAHDDHGPNAGDHDDQTHGAEVAATEAHTDLDDPEADADGHAGHDHGALDPHAWLDPANAKVWLDAIAAELSSLDPENAGAYLANAAAGKTEIDALILEIDGILDPVRDRNFIVFHDAYQYFEAAFDFPASGAISLSDAARPSPARVQEIHDRVTDANITCVLAEPQFNPDLVETVLDGTDARPAVIDPLGSTLSPGPLLYPQLLRDLGKALAGCL